MKAKDTQINNLKLKEGELKGKDEVIATLNRNLDKLQQQLDTLYESFNQNNPLKSIVDNLTAQNLEVEALFKS